MVSTFFGLEIGRKALQSQTTALDVTGHNIANANTEGYTRQRAIMTTPTPFAYPSFYKPLSAGQLGTGVNVEEVKRLRDSFIDSQIRKENSVTGYWENRKNTLDKIEVIINEPSESGLRTVLDQFWESLQTLSTRPEDRSLRATVAQRGMAVADTFQHMDKQFADLQADLNQSVDIKVDEINNITTQIAGLNEQIVAVEASNDNANDLRDKRDLLVDQLAKIVNINVVEDQFGSTSIAIGSRSLVSGKTPTKLMTVIAPLTGFYDVKWEDGTFVDLKSGELQGLIYSRDTITQDMRDQINTLATNYINEVNAQHQAGYGLDGVNGYSFFSGTNATTIQVHSDITSIPNGLDHIAAAGSLPLAEGDNANALLLTGLKHDATTMGTSTFDDYFRGIAAQLGIDGQAAGRMVDNQGLLVSQLNTQQQQLSGVSLDEEMTNMIKFQHAYNAASRVVTSMDEMLDTIISRMGLVGR